MKYRTIKEHHLFSKAYLKGNRYSGRYLSVFILKDYLSRKLTKANPEKKPYNRLGISATKKIGGAVQRNRAKRLIRTAYWSLEPSLKTGFLVVITPKAELLTVKEPAVEKDLKRGFEKLGMNRSGDAE